MFGPLLCHSPDWNLIYTDLPGLERVTSLPPNQQRCEPFWFWYDLLVTWGSDTKKHNWPPIFVFTDVCCMQMSDKGDNPQSIFFVLCSIWHLFLSFGLFIAPFLHYYLWHPTYQPTTSQIKMHMPNTFLMLSLSVLSTALPTLAAGSDTRITASQITTIAPKSQSCANAPVPKGGAPECANAQEAAVNIGKSFETYNVTSRAEQAAVIALMAFESVEFQFNRKQGLGVEGQGSEFFSHPLIRLYYFFVYGGVNANPGMYSPQHAITHLQ